MAFATRIQPAVSATLGSVKKFALRDEGAVAIEFAAIMLLLFVPMILVFAETSKGNHLSTQVGQTASTVSDIISQAETMTADDIDAALAAGQAIAGPQAGNQIKLSIVGVEIVKIGENNATTKVKWSRAINGGALPPVNSPYPMPASLLTQSGFVIVSNASMSYVPAVGHALTGSFPLSSTNYFIPRRGFQTSCEGCN